MPLKLSVRLSPQDPPFEFELDDAEILVGRGAHCHVQLPFPFISNHHLTIISEGDAFLVSDTGSTNGTRLGETRIGPDSFTPLSDGDCLTLGEELEVHISITQALGRTLSVEESSEQVRRMVWDTLQSQGDDSQARVEVTRGPDHGARANLPEDNQALHLGRDEGCFLTLSDPALHLEHLAITRRGYSFYAEPLHEQIVRVSGSVLFTSQLLRDGDILELGATELRFHDPLQSYLEELSALPADDDVFHEPNPMLETMKLDVDVTEGLPELPHLGPPDRPPTRNRLRLDQTAPASSDATAEDGDSSWGVFELLILALALVVVGGGLIILLLIFNVI